MVKITPDTFNSLHALFQRFLFDLQVCADSTPILVSEHTIK